MRLLLACHTYCVTENYHTFVCLIFLIILDALMAEIKQNKCEIKHMALAIVILFSFTSEIKLNTITVAITVYYNFIFLFISDM